MELIYFGHNTFLVQKNETSILIDPWFSSNGAFFGSWFQYPINHKFSMRALSTLKEARKRYIFITHEHLDHFDYDFLKTVGFDVKILIPKFKGKFLQQKLSSLKHDILELEDNSRYDLSEDLSVKLLISDIGVNHDSAIVIDDGEKRFLNQNDCKVFDRLHEVGKIDYYSVQFSGANAYPSTFDYPERVKTDISLERAQSKISNIIDFVCSIKPMVFLPSAGPVIFPFLDESLSLGVGNIFVHQNFLDEQLKIIGWSNVSYLRPGDTLDPSNLNHSPIKPPTVFELREIKSSLDCQWDSLSLELDISSLMFVIRSRLAKLSDITLSETPILQFIWGKKSRDGLSINLNTKTVELGYDPKIKSFVRLNSEPKYFGLMADLNYRWQDISLSMRAIIKRRPDVFSNNIFLFLFSDIDNIYSSFISSQEIPTDKCIVSHKGDDYKIDRYCPHQGADLSKGKIDNEGNLICPRHGWKFRLNNSGKNIAMKATINAKLC